MDREKRLAKQRSYRQNESSEAREKRLAKPRSYRQNESSEAREKRLAKQRSKHSVCPADRIKLVNPDVAKYLQNFKSVDNVEWLCNTCSNHLRKGNVPPCAIANGMKFPEKPNFLILMN